MNFSRLAFFNKSCKAIQTSLENAIFQNTSKFCTNCALGKDDVSEKSITGTSGNVTNTNEIDDIQSEIKAANKAHKKALLEIEAKLMRKRYTGRYKSDGALHVPVLLGEVLSCFERLKNKV